MNGDDMLAPVVGPTGSTVTSYRLRVDRARDVVHFGPPSPPRRDVYYTDDDGQDHFVRTLTEDEWAEKQSQYEAAVLEYRRTNGVSAVAGPTTITCEATCADGTTCSGVLAGTEWRWAEWSTSPSAGPSDSTAAD